MYTYKYYIENAIKIIFNTKKIKNMYYSDYDVF